MVMFIHVKPAFCIVKNRMIFQQPVLFYSRVRSQSL